MIDQSGIIPPRLLITDTTKTFSPFIPFSPFIARLNHEGNDLSEEGIVPVQYIFGKLIGFHSITEDRVVIFAGFTEDSIYGNNKRFEALLYELRINEPFWVHKEVRKTEPFTDPETGMSGTRVYYTGSPLVFSDYHQAPLNWICSFHSPESRNNIYAVWCEPGETKHFAYIQVTSDDYITSTFNTVDEFPDYVAPPVIGPPNTTPIVKFVGKFAENLKLFRFAALQLQKLLKK